MADGHVGAVSAEVYCLRVQKQEDFAVVNASQSAFVYENEIGRAHV